MADPILRLIELAERLTPSGVIGDGMVATFHETATLARLAHMGGGGSRALALVAEMEWSGVRHGQGSGPHGSGSDGHPYDACPRCGGLREPSGEFVSSAVGHRPGCPIADVLGRETVIEPGETGRLAL